MTNEHPIILSGIISDSHNITEGVSTLLKTELLYIEMSLKSINVITLEFANFGSPAFSSSSPAVLESSAFSLSCLYSFTLQNNQKWYFVDSLCHFWLKKQTYTVSILYSVMFYNGLLQRDKHIICLIYNTSRDFLSNGVDQIVFWNTSQG